MHANLCKPSMPTQDFIIFLNVGCNIKTSNVFADFKKKKSDNASLSYNLICRLHWQRAAGMLGNLLQGNIKHRRRHIDVKTLLIRLTWTSCMGTDLLLPVWKKGLGKQLPQWVWMDVSQVSQTPGLGPYCTPPLPPHPLVGGKTPAAMEAAGGQRHLCLKAKIFWYGWTQQFEGFIKMPEQPGCSSAVRSHVRPPSGGCSCLSVTPTSLTTTSTSVLKVTMWRNCVFFNRLFRQQLVNICQVLITAVFLLSTS